MTSAPALWRVENGGGVGWGALGFADYCQTSSQFSERPLFQGIKMERGSQMETPDILLVSCTRVPAPSHMCSHPTHKTHTVKVNTMKKRRGLHVQTPSSSWTSRGLVPLICSLIMPTVTSPLPESSILSHKVSIDRILHSARMLLSRL